MMLQNLGSGVGLLGLFWLQFFDFLFVLFFALLPFLCFLIPFDGNVLGSGSAELFSTCNMNMR